MSNPESNKSNAAARISNRSHIQRLAAAAPECAASTCAAAPIYFLEGAGGRSKTCQLQGGDRQVAPHAYPHNSESFFLPRAERTNRRRGRIAQQESMPTPLRNCREIQ